MGRESAAFRSPSPSARRGALAAFGGVVCALDEFLRPGVNAPPLSPGRLALGLPAATPRARPLGEAAAVRRLCLDPHAQEPAGRRLVPAFVCKLEHGEARSARARLPEARLEQVLPHGLPEICAARAEVDRAGEEPKHDLKPPTIGPGHGQHCSKQTSPPLSLSARHLKRSERPSFQAKRMQARLRVRMAAAACIICARRP